MSPVDRETPASCATAQGDRAERRRSDKGASSPPAPDIATEPRSGDRRMILLTHHFPPDPAVGGLRWQKLARYAADRGWGIDVFAGHPDALPAIDPDPLGDLPAGVRIYHVPAPRLRLARIVDGLWRMLRPVVHGAGGPPTARAGSLNAQALRWWPRGRRDVARAWFAWMQHRQEVAWGRAASRLARAVLERGVHRIIISCGPPHGVHVGAGHLAGQAGLPFVMDLRDPWRLLQRLPEAVASKAGLALARHHEQRCVTSAALIVANSDTHCDALRRLYPRAAARICVVPNGCDDDPLPPRRFERRFIVAYAGNVYLDRDPGPFFRAVALLAREAKITPADFGIEFMGAVESHDGVPLETIAAAEGVAPFLRLHPRGTRAEAQAFLAGAALLLILPQDSTYAIPAKLYEYLRHEAWVLALATRGSATARRLEDSGADLAAPNDVPGIAAVLRRRYDQHRRGEHGVPLGSDPRYARRTQADILFESIESIVGAPARTGERELIACAAS